MGTRGGCGQRDFAMPIAFNSGGMHMYIEDAIQQNVKQGGGERGTWLVYGDTCNVMIFA